MNPSVQDIIVAVFTLVVIPLLVRPLAYKLAMFLDAKFNEAWARTSQANKQSLEKLVEDARIAFVKLNADGAITDAVNKERDYVVNYAQSWFTTHGFNLDAALVINEFAKQVQLGVDQGLKGQG
jgi:hypothetical protein